MNATSLYVSTSRLIFQNESPSDQSLSDLYRLVPYLRQSLSCTVCGHLLMEPFSPVDVHCQHHVCKLCVHGRKNLKPICNLCKDNSNYEENIQMRILLQCYKSLCEYIMTTPFYNLISEEDKAKNNGFLLPNASLIEFIQEGAKFEDDFKPNSGLTKNAYSILPCIFNNPASLIATEITTNTNNKLSLASSLPNRSSNYLTSTVLTPATSSSPSHQESIVSTVVQPPPIKTVSNGSAMYSVLYTGIGNKITIKRKTDGDEELKKPQNVDRPRIISKRRGCRCGNATIMPGKLTCCGQRCPCYVESKACLDCKCRGCRNPHRPDGGKIRPLIPELAYYEIQVADESANLLSTPSNDCLELPINNSENSARKHIIKNPINIGPSLVGSSSLRQLQPKPEQEHSSTLEKFIKHEPLLINSLQDDIQVMKLFTSRPKQQNNLGEHHIIGNSMNSSIISSHTKQISQMKVPSSDIYIQQSETLDEFPMLSSSSTTLLSSSVSASQSLSKNQTNSTSSLSSSVPQIHNSTVIPLLQPTLALSPLIMATSSRSLPNQIFNENVIHTTSNCSSESLQQTPNGHSAITANKITNSNFQSSDTLNL